MKSKQLISLKIIATTIVILLSVPAGCKAPSPKEVTYEHRVGLLPPTAQLLFVSNRDTGTRSNEIYAMKADGGDVTRITFTNEHHFITGIDRSRRYIVTSRAVEDTHRPRGLGNEDRRSLWVIDLETKNETRLTDPRFHAEGDSFSPDGQWIVFLMKRGDKDQLDIYKIRRDGSNLVRLTNTLKASEGDPTWSNDGRRIAFTYIDGRHKKPRFILKTMDVNGDNIKTVSDVGSHVRKKGVWPPGDYDPSWSPDDQWIVFGRAVGDGRGNAGSGNWHIFKIKTDGSGLEDLSLAGGHVDRAEYLPSYSPDGKLIVFGSIHQASNKKDSHVDIFIMDTSGGSLKRLTHHPKNDMYPAWIPSDN